MVRLLLPLLALSSGCGAEPVRQPGDRGAAPALSAPAPVLKRLTAAQYSNAVTDLLGEGLVLPSSLEPDAAVEGLYALGAGVGNVSSWGVEKYEEAAFDLAEQALADPTLKAALVPCTPTATVDSSCARAALEALGLRTWRRPLSDDELDVLVALADSAATTLGDFDQGLSYAVAALLQSPNFLYRAELGEADPDDPAARRYSDYEMAGRLSFFLWNTTPDDELLAAAAAGELTDDAGLATQVERLLADARSDAGVRSFFTEYLRLYELPDVSKDPTVYVHWSSDLPDAAAEETLLGVDALVFEDQGPLQDLLITQRAFVDRRLAAIYDVAAPERDGHGEVWLPDAGGRRGLLGQVSFLAAQAHSVSTSVTNRGIFVREVLLCQPLPDPPADANTAIPAVSDDALTMRDRIAVHLEDPTCASCHNFTDPIGLGFENFDGVGRFRLSENGATIDPSGELDGVAFADAWGLSQAVADHQSFPNCFTQTVYKYATGQLLDDGQDALLDWHEEGFGYSLYRVLPLLRDIALSPGFRTAGEVEE
jgi:Protein of unknown function (DUF1592)/Protein of unknown function (DUF1588)/Protein of unknown function (DUF1595)/Protein of unknown function (DUF1587)